MAARWRDDLPLSSPVPESADSEHQQPAAAAFDAALDHVLRAWAEGREIASEEIARVHPDLGGEVDAVFGLAREIALLRPVVKPHVPGYRVLGELGRGGMGIVYAAQQEGLNRRVAVSYTHLGSVAPPLRR